MSLACECVWIWCIVLGGESKHMTNVLCIILRNEPNTRKESIFSKINLTKNILH